MAKHQTSGNCECEVCQALADGASPEQVMADVAQWQEACLEKYGFFAHLVRDDPDVPFGFNAHTHGLDLLGHADFQLVAPLPADTAYGLLGALAKRVIGGETFQVGQRVDRILDGYRIKLVAAVETGRPVLRVIIPDAAGELDRERIGGQHVPRQYEGVVDG